MVPFSRNMGSAGSFGENHRLRLARWFSPRFFALSIFREFGLDLGFDSHSRQNSISFNSRELFGQINGELQGENSESSVRNDEEAWSG